MLGLPFDFSDAAFGEIKKAKKNIETFDIFILKFSPNTQ